jgi:hypothetical protein
VITDAPLSGDDCAEHPATACKEVNETSMALSARTGDTTRPAGDTPSDVTAFSPALTGRDAWETLSSRAWPRLTPSLPCAWGRRRLSADDAADLASTVRLRMMVDDYAIL